MTNINVCETKISKNLGARVLIVVAGESPQVITETIFALASHSTPFVPNHLRIVTTAIGKNRILESLLQARRYEALEQQLGLTLPKLTPDIILVPKRPNGEPDQDAHSPDELERMGDLMLSTLLDWQEEPESTVHVSLAGGRKTMSFMAGQVMTLVARHQDRLSHVVLSDPRFEFNRDFFFPPDPPVELEVRSRGDTVGVKVSTSKVEVLLVDVPFVRLSGLMPKELLENLRGFHLPEKRLSQLIDQTNQALAHQLSAVIILDPSNRSLTCNGITVKLNLSNFSVIYHLAKLKDRGLKFSRSATDIECKDYLESRAELAQQMGNSWIDSSEESSQSAREALFGQRLFNSAEPVSLSELTFDQDRRSLLAARGDFFSTKVSKINAAMRRALTPIGALRFCIQRSEKPAVYFLPPDLQLKWKPFNS